MHQDIDSVRDVDHERWNPTSGRVASTFAARNAPEGRVPPSATEWLGISATTRGVAPANYCAGALAGRHRACQVAAMSSLFTDRALLWLGALLYLAGFLTGLAALTRRQSTGGLRTLLNSFLVAGWVVQMVGLY